jgi:hypothetical protein
MRLRRSLLLSLTAAIAMLAFASSALAGTGALVHDSTGEFIPNGTEITTEGNAKFETLGTGIECTTATGTLKVTNSVGSTGQITKFAPTTSTCNGFGSIFKGCKLTADTVEGLPYHVTATDNKLDVTGEIVITGTTSNCTNSKITSVNLFFSSVTLEPMNTSGNTAATGETISAVELHGEGIAKTNVPSELSVEAGGVLQILGAARCTYRFK